MRIEQPGIDEVARQVRDVAAVEQRDQHHAGYRPTATMPASVGVNQPVRMPPMMISGIISGSTEARAASANSQSVARGFLMPTGPKKCE